MNFYARISDAIGPKDAERMEEHMRPVPYFNFCHKNDRADAVLWNKKSPSGSSVGKPLFMGYVRHVYAMVSTPLVLSCRVSSPV